MIKKRDGSLQKFNQQKIIDAVILSGASEEAADYIAEYVKQALIPEMTVFEIESLVEDLLLELDTKAAHEYISYRAKRAAERQIETPLFKSVLSVLAQNNPEVTKENANIDGKTLAASRHILAGEMSKALAQQTLPQEVLDAHDSGAIHFHDHAEDFEHRVGEVGVPAAGAETDLAKHFAVLKRELGERFGGGHKVIERAVIPQGNEGIPQFFETRDVAITDRLLNVTKARAFFERVRPGIRNFLE